MRNFFLIILFLWQLDASAQWVTQTDVNTDVATSSVDDMKAIGTASGKTYIVFWKAVSAPTNYELRVQLLNNQGVKQFGPDGVLVSNTMAMSTSTAIMKIAVDAAENIYIGATGTNGGIGYAFKLNASGTHVWPSSGINLGGGYMVTILPLSTGDAMIAWNASNQTMLQKFSATGTAVWPAPVQVSNGATNGKSPADLFELSNNECLLVFHVLSFGINSTLWAQKYNAAGVPQWANVVQLSNKGTAYNTIYSAAQDGDIVYYGYKGATGTHFDSYLQRINPDGTLPWAINGKDFDVTTLNNEMETKIAFSPGSSSVWSICNYANSAQSSFGVYVQKFDKLTGARQLGDSAKVIYAIGTSNVSAGDLLLINNNPVFLLKSGYDNGATPTSLHACRLDANGNFAWSYQTKPMGTYVASKKRIHFSKNANGAVVASFCETKANGISMAYAHSVSTGNNNAGTAVVSACGSYTWVNNQTYTSSTNTPTYVYTNSTGGDSTVTLNLTITPVLIDTTVVSACDSYTWNGNTYTNSGIYQGSTVNCHTPYLNLSITPSTIHNLAVNACGSYVWNGTIYTTSGIYTGPTQNCVTETINLTITPGTSDTTVQTACDAYTWNGNTYTSSGLYAGPSLNCHTPYLQLTITASTSDTSVVNTCGTYNWNGQDYSASGIYQGPTFNCAMSYLNLTITPFVASVTAQDMTLTASISGASYQWLNCATNLPLTGATAQSFTATDPGSYAVVVTLDGCSDTSSCMQVTDASISNIDAFLSAIYPNPSTGLFDIEYQATNGTHFWIKDAQGRCIQEGIFEGQQAQVNIQSCAAGIYYLQTEQHASTYRLVKY